jgi:hypothetical protein
VAEDTLARVLYRETHVLLDELADAVADGTRKECTESVATVPLAHHANSHAPLQRICWRSSCATTERFGALLMSNRPVEDRVSCSVISLP